jgi:hypothetical protein
MCFELDTRATFDCTSRRNQATRVASRPIFAFEHFGNGAAAFRLGGQFPGRRLRRWDLDHHDWMDGRDGQDVSDSLQCDVSLRVYALGGELGLVQDQRQCHGEAAGMRRADQLRTDWYGLFAEAVIENVGSVLERTALGGKIPLQSLKPRCQRADADLFICITFDSMNI